MAKKSKIALEIISRVGRSLIKKGNAGLRAAQSNVQTSRATRLKFRKSGKKKFGAFKGEFSRDQIVSNIELSQNMPASFRNRFLNETGLGKKGIKKQKAIRRKIGKDVLKAEKQLKGKRSRSIDRKINLRAKGVKFIRIRGRIVPILPRKRKK